jgi:hypothetical protein
MFSEKLTTSFLKYCNPFHVQNHPCLYIKALYGCLLDLVCMSYLYQWFQCLFLAHINCLCFAGQWCALDSNSPRSFKLLSGIFPKLLLARALAVLQLLGSPWPVVWRWRLRWPLASTISSELRRNRGDGDGYIPSGELLGFPPSSSTHSGTSVSQTLNRGDSMLRLCSVWLVLVQFYSMWLCCCKKLILIV